MLISCKSSLTYHIKIPSSHDTGKVTTVKLNFGCGDKMREGYVNVDLYGNPDVRCDLSVFPWPFEDNCADEVLSEHFLEHVTDFEKTIFEMHRILKPGGTLHFIVPYFKSPAFPWHLHHYAFSSVTCKLLCEQRPYMLQGRKLFNFVKLKFLYFMRPCFSRMFSMVANRCQTPWEYFGLPIDGIEFWATKVHPSAT